MTSTLDARVEGPPGTTPRPPPAPAGARGRSTAYWAMATLIATEATIFVGLLATYFFLRAASPRWPLGGIEEPEILLTGIFSIVLIGSSLPVAWAERAIKRGNAAQARVGLVLGFLSGAAFIGHSVYEYLHLDFAWTDNAYASIHYTTTGLHGLHVVVGLAMSLQVQAKLWMGRLSAERHTSMQVFGMYWHFVDVVWIFVFSSLYLSFHV